MAKTILINSDLWLGDFWETVSDIVVRVAKTWELPEEIVNDRLDEVALVAVEQAAHKLKVDLHATWKYASNTYAVVITSPEKSRDIEKIANAERAFVSFASEGVVLSKRRDDDSFIPLESLTEVLDRFTREYIETAVFLVLGSIRAGIQNPSS
jgi:hypothetical protein